VAIVGISTPDRFGGILFNNLKRFGFTGEIYGVNPRYPTLYDKPCYPSLSALPNRPDFAVLGVPNSRLLPALQEVIDCGIPAAAIFANAHSEEGEPSLQAELKQLAVENDLILLGPNCMGFLAPGAARLSISGFPTNAETPGGNVTFVSHSGSVWEAVLQNKRQVAFNYIVSTGNELVTTVADVIQFALEDETTRAIGLFLETVRDPETFIAALAEAANRDIPIVVVKTGSSPRGAELAQAHTGALTGEDGAYDALFQHYGVRRARSLDEMMDTLELFSSGIRTRSPYAAAVLDSGGQRALLVDLGEREGLKFADISDATKTKLESVLDPGLLPVNPLDAWGTGNNSDDIFTECLYALDSDPATGINVMAVDLLSMDDEEEDYSRMMSEMRSQLRNPVVFLTHLSASLSSLQTKRLRDLKVPILMGTETGIRALVHLVEYSDFQRKLKSEGRKPIADRPQPKNFAALRDQLQGASAALGEHASKQFMLSYGLTTTREAAVSNLDAALKAANEIGYPVALKTCGDLHKTENDGVRLGLAGPDELTEAYRDFADRLGAEALVQEMIPPGTELLLGIVCDPQFGPMLTLGTGGIFVEVMKDITMLVLPTHPDTVREALLSLRGAALLQGARGKPSADLKAVVDAAMGLATLAMDLGEWIAEIDINPLVALPDRAVVVDALIVPKKLGD
jgi:acyl-CoA synthetase (NDP forming)